ncbi:hypothetical protein D915_010552 [Fasciola hepatica]|uniref:Uncharacterized protein n=1 Tax=Fasciola hepatica TaxID=6192 RepID=A0A4E0RPR5_FASHE|nr:hypothetical protein D915_010552 [Fasciola hepatica]
MIVDHVKANRQRNAQRTQWLNKSRDPNTSSGVVTSSMIASPSPSQSGNGARGTPQTFQSPESPVLTPVKRSVTNDPVNSTSAAHVAVVAATLSPNIMNTNHSGPVAMTNESRPSFPNAENFEIIKSATLPANVHHISK